MFVCLLVYLFGVLLSFFFHFDNFVCNFPLYPADKDIIQSNCAVRVCCSEKSRHLYEHCVRNFIMIELNEKAEPSK